MQRPNKSSYEFISTLLPRRFWHCYPSFFDKEDKSKKMAWCYTIIQNCYYFVARSIVLLSLSINQFKICNWINVVIFTVTRERRGNQIDYIGQNRLLYKSEQLWAIVWISKKIGSLFNYVCCDHFYLLRNKSHGIIVGEWLAHFTKEGSWMLALDHYRPDSNTI